jgi:hypothetical protein
MADAIWKEYELFCPVCNAYFKRLVVLHNRSDMHVSAAPGEKSNRRSFNSSRRAGTSSATREFGLDSCLLRGRKIQIQVSRAVELESCCAVDLAHRNKQVPLVRVDAVQAVIRGKDSYGGEGRTVLEDNCKGL